MSTPEPVGEILRNHLAGLGWRQKDLAEVMGRPQQWVSEVISGKKVITVLAATELAAATNTAPGFWLAAQDRYRLWALSQNAPHTKGLEEILLRAAERR